MFINALRLLGATLHLSVRIWSSRCDFSESAVHIHMLDQTQISDHTYNNKTDVYWPLLTGRHNILDTEQRETLQEQMFENAIGNSYTDWRDTETMKSAEKAHFFHTKHEWEGVRTIERTRMKVGREWHKCIRGIEQRERVQAEEMQWKKKKPLAATEKERQMWDACC